MSYGRIDTYPVFLLHSDRFSHRCLFAPAHPFGLHSLCWSLWKETLAQRSHPRCDVGLWKDSSCLGEQASVSSFLSKEFQKESATLHLPRCCKPEVWSIWTKMQSLEVQLSKPNIHKSVLGQWFAWLPELSASWAVWLSSQWNDAPYCKFPNNSTAGR